MRRYCWLFAAVIIWTGCGREERREATSFVKILTQKQSDLAAINYLEKDLLGSTRAWCESIIANGAGKAKDLTDNAVSAKELAKSAEVVSAQLGQLRQEIYGHPLKQEFTMEVRANLLKQISVRQRVLQDVRTGLQTSASNFEQYAQTRDYKGDSYPPEIDRLYSKLSTYSGPEDVMGKAIKELKVKYTIEEKEVLGKT
jgi:hypothetical protein